MLEPRHIVKLRIPARSLSKYRYMPVPREVSSEKTRRMLDTGNAVICDLLSMAPEIFAAQLSAAHAFGASYITEDERHNVIGISHSTSTIRSGDDILRKNLILPQDLTVFNPALKKHYIVSAFVRPDEGGDDSVVEVAGWTEAGIARTEGRQPPPGFKSKIPVTAMPCIALSPIDELVSQLATENLAV